MEDLKIIAFTHKEISFQSLGKLTIPNDLLKEKLHPIKLALNISEIFYLSTCNRVEFIFITKNTLNTSFIVDFLSAIDFNISKKELDDLSKKASTYEEEKALTHLLRVSCSLESLVVGEKEILAQLRKAYEFYKHLNFTGDRLRLIMNHVVKTAKEVYTFTKIAKKPISIVSLAYRKLKELKPPSNARIIIIGAGVTNQHLSKYLKKHTYSNFTVFNRTLTKAQKLAKELNGQAFDLNDLRNYKKGFDILISCTGAKDPIITESIYKNLLNGEPSSKVIVDLAIPNDICPNVLANYPIHLIQINSLKKIANKNLKERYKELVYAERIIDENIQKFKPILKQRKVELAMSKVPKQIKKIKQVAIESIFAEDIQMMDKHSFEVLTKVINYIEKKYISIPMIMAKEILLKE